MTETAATRGKKVFTTGQVAKICKVAPRTVSKWFDSGRLKGYRIPGSQDRRIPRQRLIEFLTANNMPLDELEVDGRLRVLVVTSDEQFEAQLHAEAAGEDYVFEATRTAFATGRRVSEFKPDAVVLVDLLRSEAAGIAHSLRSEPATATVYLAGVVSEDVADPDAVKAHGFDDVFKRPVDVAAVAAALAAHAAAVREG